VTLIALDDGTQLSGLQRIVENDANGDVSGDVPPLPPTEPTGKVADDPSAEENP
jgi:DNA gyrase subunit A